MILPMERDGITKLYPSVQSQKMYVICIFFSNIYILLKLNSYNYIQFQVQVIPWILENSNYVKSSSQRLDAHKTVFVGALHGMLTAAGLAKVMDDLFHGVIYAGV